jgi:hypothetical protein
MAAVRRLTPEGISRFRDWINQGGPGPAPASLLTDPETSEPLGGTATLDMGEFASRYEFGEYLVEQLSSLPASVIRFDPGVWDWISLYYIDMLAPVRANGTRDVKEDVRYSLELRNRKWSRHLVRMNWMALNEHGPMARVMLSLPVNKHSDVLEQLAGQQETFGARSVVQLADKLYWDPCKGAVKRGAGGKGGGTPRRLVRFMRQFRRTYDPPAMSPDQLVASLPAEFDRWKPAPPGGGSEMRAEARP